MSTQLATKRAMRIAPFVLLVSLLPACVVNRACDGFDRSEGQYRIFFDNECPFREAEELVVSVTDPDGEVWRYSKHEGESASNKPGPSAECTVKDGDTEVTCWYYHTMKGEYLVRVEGSDVVTLERAYWVSSESGECGGRRAPEEPIRLELQNRAPDTCQDYDTEVSEEDAADPCELDALELPGVTQLTRFTGDAAVEAIVSPCLDARVTIAFAFDSAAGPLGDPLGELLFCSTEEPINQGQPNVFRCEFSSDVFPPGATDEAGQLIEGEPTPNGPVRMLVRAYDRATGDVMAFLSVRVTLDN